MECIGIFERSHQIRSAKAECQTLAFWIRRQSPKSRERASFENEREHIGIIFHAVFADNWMHVQFVRKQIE